MRFISRRQFVSKMPIMGAGTWLGLDHTCREQGAAWPVARQPGTVFESVRIFDSTSYRLSSVCDALVNGDTIERVSLAPLKVGRNVTVVAGRGRT